VSWALDKSQEWLWFGVTTVAVVAVPVLVEMQREAMFQMEREQLAEQQEAMQRQLQEAATSRGVLGMLGGGGPAPAAPAARAEGSA
jgi:heme exporter protein D